MATLGALALLLLLRVLMPGDRRRRRSRTIMLLLTLFLQLVGLLFQMLGAGSASAVVNFIGFLLLIFAVTGMADLVIFEALLARLQVSAPPILRDILQALVFFVLTITALSRVGVEVGHLVTTSAVLTAVIGLALQSIMANFFAGLALHLDNTIHIGHWIRVGNQVGRITQMNWRATCMVTRDGDVVIVPNAEMVKAEVVNYSTPTVAHRWAIRIPFDYRHPPNQVRRVIVDAITGTPNVLPSPAPDCWPVEFSENALWYVIRYWTEDFARDVPIDGEVRLRMWYAAQRAGLRIAGPRLALTMDQPDASEESARFLRERTEALSRIDLFASLTASEKELLAKSLKLERFAAGEPIIRQGDPGDSLYLIHAGQVGVVLKVDSDSSEIAALGPGSFFGEMSLITGQPRATTCIARTDVDCFVLRHSAFRSLLSDRPAMAEDISQVIASRQTALQAERDEISAEAKERRAREASTHLLSSIRKFFNLGQR